MAECEQVRDFGHLRERAARFLALAQSARDEGQPTLANRLAQLAAESYEKAASFQNAKNAERI